ncbi:MAG: hypothetical protein WCR36_02350 [Bacteroidaceae bacterium]
MKVHTYAGIDIGSNAIRLLINEIESTSSGVNYSKACYIRVPIRLGEDVFTQGFIGEEKRLRMIAAFQGFHHLMQAYGVTRFRCCATSAMREAANGGDVVKEIAIQSGIPIEIITGQEEADLVYHASGSMHIFDDKRNYLYVDVGGGSTEIICYAGGEKRASRSFKLGTVRILAHECKDEFEAMAQWIGTTCKEYNPVAIIGSGGNINKLHKMLGRKQLESIYYFEMKRLYEQSKTMNLDERMKHFSINAYRADVIVPAMTIFLTIAELTAISEFIVPKVGLGDGIIHQLYWVNHASHSL